MAVKQSLSLDCGSLANKAAPQSYHKEVSGNCTGVTQAGGGAPNAIPEIGFWSQLSTHSHGSLSQLMYSACKIRVFFPWVGLVCVSAALMFFFGLRWGPSTNILKKLLGQSRLESLTLAMAWFWPSYKWVLLVKGWFNLCYQKSNSKCRS